MNGGFHLLAIFEPSAETAHIDSLLGRVEYQGTKGDSDGVTRASAVQVVQAVLDAGRHSHPRPCGPGKKGLLRVNPGTQESALDAHTVGQVMAVEDLLAVEWLDTELLAPACVGKESRRLAKVLGSDCHSFRSGAAARFPLYLDQDGRAYPGRAAPLRSSMVTGSPCDEATKENSSRSGDSSTIRYRDRDRLGPVYGQRYAGTTALHALLQCPDRRKRPRANRTIVHALRLAYRRNEELRHLGEKTEPYRQFTSFIESFRSREGDGALRDDTEIRIELMRDGIHHLLRWSQDSQSACCRRAG